MKLLFSVIASLLMIAFIGPVAWRLKEVSLIVVVLIGLAMMVFDMWQSLREKD